MAASAAEISNASRVPTTAAVGISSELDKDEEKKNKRESVLCTRLAGAHSKAITALLVLHDRGT